VGEGRGSDKVSAKAGNGESVRKDDRIGDILKAEMKRTDMGREDDVVVADSDRSTKGAGVVEVLDVVDERFGRA
jgi:hypothetical protein